VTGRKRGRGKGSNYAAIFEKAARGYRKQGSGKKAGGE